MTKDSSSELPDWVCVPDEDDSHLTTYTNNEIGGGCKEHLIAGGCSIPQADLKALIAQDRQELLKRIEGEIIAKMEDIPFEFRGPSEQEFIAPKIARNQALSEVHSIINAIRESI